MTDRAKQLQDEYLANCHKIQSGVVLWMNYDGAETSPKHLRVGVNMALLSSAAVARLCIEKGIFTEEEYFERLVEVTSQEVKNYEDMINERLGVEGKVKLG